MSDSNVMQPLPHTQSGAGVYNEKLGMWVFLGSEVMFFTALIGSYLILRVGNPGAWPEGGPKEVLNIPITAANTFLLICSSVSMVKAFASIAAGNQRGSGGMVVGDGGDGSRLRCGAGVRIPPAPGP